VLQDLPSQREGHTWSSPSLYGVGDITPEKERKKKKSSFIEGKSQ
jgi:hypothetical protein